MDFCNEHESTKKAIWPRDASRRADHRARRRARLAAGLGHLQAEAFNTIEAVSIDACDQVVDVLIIIDVIFDIIVIGIINEIGGDPAAASGSAASDTINPTPITALFSGFLAAPDKNKNAALAMLMLSDSALLTPRLGPKNSTVLFGPSKSIEAPVMCLRLTTIRECCHEQETERGWNFQRAAKT